jgi:thioesterase DpgC
MSDALAAAGLPSGDVAAWRLAEPGISGAVAMDQQRFAAFWTLGERLLAALPAPGGRKAVEAAAARAVHDACRAGRERFLKAHAGTVYAAVTAGFSRFVRVEDLVRHAAAAFPGLVPGEAQLARDAGRTLPEKEGWETDQALLLAHLLADERCGTHLCHAMLLPHAESAAALATLRREGAVDLGPVRVERRGKATWLLSRNPRYLNAEDQTTIGAMELGVDVAILDPDTSIAVLRGEPVSHPKYAGRRIFGSGINLTHLYKGSIPFVWYLRRELGFVHKYLRGVAHPDAVPDDVRGRGIEKPWIAAVDGWAIGGHCQILLVMDYVLAAADAFMTLPARKEGIIPGAANLRLPRFTGDRLARQLIMAERRLACDSAEGRLICDEVAAAEDMDAALERTVAILTSAGAAGAIGNRRALRVGAESWETFRRYCAVYAREQVGCHFSETLVRNLERNWGAAGRR